MLIRLNYIYRLRCVTASSPDEAEAGEVEEEGADDEFSYRFLVGEAAEGHIAKLHTQGR